MSQTVLILTVEADGIATSVFALGELGSLKAHYAVAKVANNLFSQDTEL